MKDNLLRFVIPGIVILALVFSLTGCSDDDNPVGPGGLSGSNIAVVMTGVSKEYNISVIDYSTGVAYNDLLSLQNIVLHGISNLYQYGNYVYIVDKAANSIIKFDPVKREAVSDMSTGVGTDPYCMVFVSATKAYVTQNGVSTVAIVDPSQMALTGSIDIASLADEDGNPDQYDAVLKGDYLYVALRRKDASDVIEDYSSLAIIDTKTDTLVGECRLTTKGIGSSTRNCLGGRVVGMTSVGGTMYPYVTGSLKSTVDGAIEVFDPETSSSSVLIPETTIGGSLITWIFDTPTTGYAISGLSASSGGDGWGLFRFDLNAEAFTPIDAYQQSALTWGLDVTDDGLLLVGSRDEENQGVMILDTMNGYQPVFEHLIDVGLMPYIILVMR